MKRKKNEPFTVRCEFYDECTMKSRYNTIHTHMSYKRHYFCVGREKEIIHVKKKKNHAKKEVKGYKKCWGQPRANRIQWKNIVIVAMKTSARETCQRSDEQSSHRVVHFWRLIIKMSPCHLYFADKRNLNKTYRIARHKIWKNWGK